MISVVIAAHNEARVIGACLDVLLADARPDELDVTVVPNGCTDDTADVARLRPGVRVVEVQQAGKAAALNAGDAVARGFPRIYLDADIVVPTKVARVLATSLEEAAANGVLAAVPARRLDLRGRPLPVRAYFAIHNRLPVFTEGLFGRGMIALSEQGRARFERFPELLADDLFLDSQFAPEEKLLVSSVHTTVAAPLRTRDLRRRLTRVRRANAALRQAAAAGTVETPVRAADSWSWLRDVVLRRPWLAGAALFYVGLTVAAAVEARRTSDRTTWERDESTRREEPSRTPPRGIPTNRTEPHAPEGP